MEDWHIQLENKAKELNLKKEEENVVSIETDSNLRDRSDSRRRGNVDLPDIRKKIINVKKKEGKTVIKDKDIYSDVDDIIEAKGRYANTTSTEKKIYELFKVMLKLLISMRSNQLLTEEDKKRIQAEKKARQENQRDNK